MAAQFSLSVSPRSPEQQIYSDEGSPTRTHRSPYRGRPVTPTPSPRRTGVNARAATLNRSESPNDGQEIAAACPNDGRTAATTSQTPTEDPPTVNNLLVNVGGPEPVYPRQVGTRHAEDPLPMVPVAPKRYYNIYKGLKIGVFYDVWYVSNISLP